MIRNNEINRERLREIICEEFKKLRAKGKVVDDALIESVTRDFTPSYHKTAYYVFFKNN